jgi:hypothetical protein
LRGVISMLRESRQRVFGVHSDRLRRWNMRGFRRGNRRGDILGEESERVERNGDDCVH